MYEEVVIAEDLPPQTPHQPPQPVYRQRHSSFSREEAYENVSLLQPSPTPREQSSVLHTQGTGSSGTFPSFARENFQDGANHMFASKNLREPLLDGHSEEDRLAALSVWQVIQRFMSLSPKPTPDVHQQSDVPVMCRLREELTNSTAASLKNQTPAATGNRKVAGRHSLQGMLDILKGYKELHKQRQTGATSQVDDLNTSLKRAHYIIGNGILRPAIRDEIYCQICKQLTGNQDKSSHGRGWILLALCLGCFRPSPRFSDHLRSFLLAGPPAYSPFCVERLVRTEANGNRNEPPSWLELQMCKEGKPLMLTVYLMDGNTKSLESDSSSTAEEFVRQVSHTIGLTDTFGYSIYISMLDKISSLGSSKLHIQDAICQCEQYTTMTGSEARSSPWRLYFKKEVFTPWYDPTSDPVSTDLIYQQIIRGIRLGEYVCTQDVDLVDIAVKHYYIQYGATMDTNKLHVLLASVLPKSSLVLEGSSQQWVKDTERAFRKSKYPRGSVSSQAVKESIVSHAVDVWPLSFSCQYDAKRVTDIHSSQEDVIIAVNSTGIHILNRHDEILTMLSYLQIVGISCIRRYEKLQERCVAIETFLGDKHMYLTAHANAQDLCDLVTWFLQGLKSRSKFVVALDNYKALDSMYMDLNIGDLVELRQEEGKAAVYSGYYFGKNLNSGNRGYFSIDCVYILKTITKPTPQLLESMKLRDISSDTPQHVTLKKRISICI